MWSSVDAVQQAQLALVAKKTEKHMQHCLQGEPKQLLTLTIHGEWTWRVKLPETLSSKEELSQSMRAYKYDINICSLENTYRRKAVGVMGSN